MPYMMQIERMKAQAAFRCHRYVAEGYATRNQIASEAGLNWNLVKDIVDPRYNPTLKTIAALEAVVPRDWESTHGGSTASDDEPLTIGKHVLGRRELDGENSQSLKILINDQSITDLEPSQIARIRMYLDESRRVNGLLHEADYEIDVVKAIGPQCACHIYDLDGDDPGDFRAIRWDASTGYKKAIDFTGRKMGTISDSALRSCQIEDFKMVRATGWLHFAAIRRNFKGGESRSFLRLLVPFQGSDNRKKVISITRPQVFAA